MIETRVLRLTLVVALALATAGMATAIGNETAAPASIPGMGVAVAIVRDSSDPTRLLCTAEITDLSNGEVISAPKLSFRAGASAMTKSAFKADDGKTEREIVVEVSATASGNSVAYTVTDLKSGKTVGIQKGSLSLK